MIERKIENADPAAWQVFDGWILPPPPDPIQPDWHAVDEMRTAYAGVFRTYRSKLMELLPRWDSLLSSEFGKDPTRRDWREFHPLRLSREEDWSGWLAYLIG